jgi:hypothetical protein
MWKPDNPASYSVLFCTEKREAAIRSIRVRRPLLMGLNKSHSLAKQNFPLTLKKRDSSRVKI